MSFFLNDTMTTKIYTLSLHDALPISMDAQLHRVDRRLGFVQNRGRKPLILVQHGQQERSEEHTSELQSHSDLVCRLLLEKKKSQGLRSPRCTTDYPRILPPHTQTVPA